MNLTLREGLECDLAIVAATLSKHSATDPAEAHALAGSYFFAIQRQLVRSASVHARAPRAFLQHLLQLGVPANFRFHGPIHVSGSRTFLQFVARQGFSDCVETLLQHGADPKACNDFGRGPLHLAAFSGVTACVTALLRGGAPTAPEKTAHFPDGVFDKAGWSALHCAAHEGAPPEMIEALVGGGLSPNIATRSGVTAWHLAFDRDWLSAVIPERDLTFAKLLRSFLRAAPKVIMVGEIRDRETMEVSMQAANTGHFVISTIHVNNAASVPARLVDLGVLPGYAADTLVAASAQRLVRVLCPTCKVSAETTDEQREVFGRIGVETPSMLFTRGQDARCPHCRGRGYDGVTAVMEIMVTNDALRDAIKKGASIKELTTIAAYNGFRPLAHEALCRVADGVTSFEEAQKKVLLSIR